MVMMIALNSYARKVLMKKMRICWILFQNVNYDTWWDTWYGLAFGLMETIASTRCFRLPKTVGATRYFGLPESVARATHIWVRLLLSEHRKPSLTFRQIFVWKHLLRTTGIAIMVMTFFQKYFDDDRELYHHRNPWVNESIIRVESVV